jgi:hypothetical protein
MKKIILVVLLMCMTLTSSAQRWVDHYEDADELKGTQASSQHFIEIPNEGVVILEDNFDILGFVTYNGVFDYKPYEYDFNVAMGIFGTYDETGKLVGKWEIMVSVHDDPSSASADSRITVLRNSGIKQIASWIRNNKGSVRIIIPRYARSDFDVTIPTFLSQKSQESKHAKSKGTVKRKTTKKTVKK